MVISKIQLDWLRSLFWGVAFFAIFAHLAFAQGCFYKRGKKALPAKLARAFCWDTLEKAPNCINASIYAVLLAKWLGRLRSRNGLKLLQRARLVGFASPISRTQHFLFWGGIVFVVFAGVAVAQSPADSELGTGKTYGVDDVAICDTLISLAEQEKRIPISLLYAVAQVESGGGKYSRRPWPWTLNINGKGKFYPTAAAAEAALYAAIARGERNIDVGCMQINYRYHGRAFRTPATMLIPLDNVAYGASFLVALHGKHGSWDTAVKYYHSSKDKRQRAYHARVLRAWREAPPPLTASATSPAEAAKPTSAPSITSPASNGSPAASSKGGLESLPPPTDDLGKTLRALIEHIHTSTGIAPVNAAADDPAGPFLPGNHFQQLENDAPTLE